MPLIIIVGSAIQTQILTNAKINGLLFNRLLIISQIYGAVISVKVIVSFIEWDVNHIRLKLHFGIGKIFLKKYF